MAEDLLRRSKAAVRARVPVGVIRQAQRRRNAWRHRQQERFDRANGLDTAGYVWRDQMVVPGPSAAESNHYEATWRGSVRRMIRSLDVDTGAFTFVDVGSGKGAVLLYASEFSFRRILGLEHDPGLHQIALANLDAWGLAKRSTSDVTSVCIDALTFDLPAEPLVLFLCNPFHEDALVRFTERVRTSLETDPRPCLIISFNPAVEVVLDRVPWLERTGKGWSHATYRRIT